MNPVTIGATIGASFRFLRVGWSRAWGVLLLLVWLSAIIEAIQVARPDMTAFVLLFELVALFVGTGAVGALYRIGLEPDHAGDPAFAVGPAGFNWGPLEWRVLAANVIVFLILFVLAVVAIFIWALLFGATAAMQGGDLQGLEGSEGNAAQIQAFLHIMTGPAGAVSVIIGLPVVIGLLFLGAKLALVAVTTADTSRLAFGQAWSLTRGALAPIILTFLLVLLVQMVGGAVAGFIAGIFAGLFGQGVHGGALWGAVAGQAAGIALNAPLVAGLQVYVYRTKRGDVAVAQTFA